MKILKTNLIKIMTGAGFYFCIIFTITLCFSANIYFDALTNNKYSAFLALRSFDHDFMLTDTSFCSLNVINSASSGWLTMFIPIISAFAFIPLVCDEYESKSVRFEIFRIGKIRYHVSRFFTAFFCGGFAVTIGYALFSLLAIILFPSINDYSAWQQDNYFEMISNYSPEIKDTLILTLFKTLSSVLIYGAMAAVPAITLTSIIRNKYLVMCIPFFLKYALTQTCLKLQSQAFADYEHIDNSLLRFTRIINPDSIVFLQHMGSDKKTVLIYNGVLMVSALVLYMTIQSRRIDSGE